MDALMIGQPELMLIMSGVCFMITVFTLLLKFDKKSIKYSLLSMEICCFALLRVNRLALIYQGNTSDLGFLMTRICFSAVLFFIMLELAAFNSFLSGFVSESDNLHEVPWRMYISKVLFALGMAFLVMNFFTGFIFSMDENNSYVRGPGFLFCSLLFIAAIVIQLSVVISCRNKIRDTIRYAMIAYTGLIILAGILQYFFHGSSYNTFSFSCLGIILYMCALHDNQKKLEEARKREIVVLNRVLNDTSSALAGAIDAKDIYTHGHSQRVAFYAREIAKRSGKSEKECNNIYLAGLLHDVGKIGISKSIINKPSRLTDEEFAKIKEHPSIGEKILSNISDAEFLREAALCHHERFDGRGYPKHLKGEDIPEIARIIAVADSYDAMTSNRSYRKLIPQETVRSEIEKGKGTQFDPQFAECMLQMIDEDKNYDMHEK